LIREIKRKLPKDIYPNYAKQIELFEKVHSQKKKTKIKFTVFMNQESIA